MTGDDWLHPEVVDCSCGARLFRVDHSPMLDNDRLHCDRCPRFVEVSWYEARYRELVASVPDRHRESAAFLTGLEAALEPCPCGGRFQVFAPRRCFTCRQVVVVDAIDLSPYAAVCEEPDREPTAQEQADFDHFERCFRITARWRDVV